MLHLTTYYTLLHVKKCKTTTEDIAVTVTVYVIIRTCPRFIILMCLSVRLSVFRNTRQCISVTPLSYCICIIRFIFSRYTIGRKCSFPPYLTFRNVASYIKDGRTATLQMLHFIYLFSTYITTEYFKHAAHSPFFSSKCRLFHNTTFFGSCIIHILHTGCAKKNLNVKLGCQKVKGHHFRIQLL
jgi:hypothetical protein